MPNLRAFQAEDVAAVLKAHETHQSVLGRAATGLGKAVEIAALTAHYQRFGRVLVLVDVKKLVRQLAETIAWFTGLPPGIEMADERANHGGTFHAADPVIVSTVQTQYSGEEGKERYRGFDPSEFAAVLLDECELFLAPKARSVVEWFKQNPDLKIYGCTATPFRTDGVAMANLFDHLAFNRDILWGIREGWLVPARQAFVRVSIDFGTLKVRKNDEGEADYSDAEIAKKLLDNEQALIELAKGIVHVAEERRSIVVCPDVASAKAVAHYIDAERPGSARCIFGELGDEEKDDIFDAHQRGDFQFLTSVMMLTKGYDDPQIRAVFNCRKTRSKRLYTQILGRGTRPLRGLLNGLDTADARRAAIAASAKPDMLMVNMVGIEDAVRDVSVVDILGTADEQSILDRAKELVADEGMAVDDAITQATAEHEEEVACNQLMAEEEEAAREQDEWARFRRMVQVKAHVDVEYADDLRVGGSSAASSAPAKSSKGGATEKQVAFLVKLGVDRATAESYGVRQAGAVITSLKEKRCTVGQAKWLRGLGRSEAEIAAMNFDAASAAIEASKEGALS